MTKEMILTEKLIVNISIKLFLNDVSLTTDRKKLKIRMTIVASKNIKANA